MNIFTKNRFCSRRAYHDLKNGARRECANVLGHHKCSFGKPQKRHIMAAPANLCRESRTPLSTAFGGRRLGSLPLLKRTTERLGSALLESMKHPLAQEWKLSATIHHTRDEF